MFVAVAVLIVGPMFWAGFAAYDDHEIPVIHRQLQEIGPAATIASWTAEHRGRFRPLYWILRIGETAIWGETVQGWYLDRLLLLLGALAATYALARLWFAPAVAALAAILVVAGPQAEAFARLGPQEAYALPMAIAALALIGRRWFAAGLVLLVLSAFTKETFVPFALLGIAWAWYLGSRRSAVLAAVAVLIAFAFGLYRVASDGALSGQVRSLRTFATALGGLLLTLATTTVWPLGIISPHRRWLLLIGLAILIPQALILAGVAIQGRYLYPAILAGVLAAAAAAARSRLAFVVITALIAVNIAVQVEAATVRASGTRDFEAIVGMLRTADRPIVIHLAGGSPAEAAVALRRYLPDADLQLAPDLPQLTGYGFAPLAVEQACIEVDMATRPVGACEQTVDMTLAQITPAARE
jgi:hypothetical protein